jgi:hypothetical protein
VREGLREVVRESEGEVVRLREEVKRCLRSSSGIILGAFVRLAAGI